MGDEHRHQYGAAALNGQNLTIYRGDVVVYYTFRGRNYTVSMSTLRTSDT